VSYQNLIVDVRDGVACVTVNRPDKLNALDDRTMDELQAAFSALADDPAVRGVILTGAGEKAFVAGADIAELSAQSPVAGQQRSLRGQKVLDRIEGLGKPVIAAVNGFALGGGCELALACHVRVAAEGARLGTPEVKLGIMCGYGGTQRLPRLVGKGRALEMLLTGEMVDAQEALRIGLVNRVVPPGAEREEAVKLARKIAAKPAHVVKIGKEAFYRQLEMGLADAYAYASQVMVENMMARDAEEGIGAFVQKRTPTWEDR
jgi:enoyl-CoA hydratase